VYNYIRANGGFGNFTIDVIEHYPCANKTAMRIREQYWINEYKPTLNTNRAYISTEEYIDYFNIATKKHYQNNKTKILNDKKQVIQCTNCDKTYTKRHKSTHQKTTYCKNYKSTASESSSESIINSDSDTD
jgi:hypothetical protein